MSDRIQPTTGEAQLIKVGVSAAGRTVMTMRMGSKSLSAPTTEDRSKIRSVITIKTMMIEVVLAYYLLMI